MMLDFTRTRFRSRSRSRKRLWSAALAGCAALAGVSVAKAAPAQAPIPVPVYRLVRTIPLPGAAQAWDYLACDPDARRVYVAHGTEEDVIDTASGQVVGAIGGLARCHGTAIDASDGRGFIANGGGANTVVAFDLASLKVVRTIAVPAGPDAVVYQPYYHRVGVFSGDTNQMTVIDAKTLRPLGLVPLPGRPEFAVADSNGFIYDNIVDRSELVEIDPRAFTIGNTYPVAPGAEPTGLAIDQKNGKLFAACSNQTLIAMNADTGTVVTSLPIGQGADACAFDPGLNRVYTSNGRSGTVTVATHLRDTDDQYAVAATLPTLPGARTMTVDTKTHHLFVAAPVGDKLEVLEYAPVEK